MTIKAKIVELLVSHGMFEDDARTVLQELEKGNDSMRGRWDEDTAAYPQPLLATLWYSAKVEALKWIDANCPNAWYRSMFDEHNAGA